MDRLLSTKSIGRGARWAALILTVALYPSVAFAHAKLIRSQPAAQATLQQAPRLVELWFSEELEQTFNTIVVTDGNGKRVDKNNVTVGEGGKKLQIDLEELKPGVYTVEWKALSADQHTIKGDFTFTVESGAAAAPEGSVQHSGPGEHAPQEAVPPASPGDTTGALKEIKASWAFSVVRWLEYLSMMALFGGFGFLLLVFKPSLGRMSGTGEERAMEALEKSARRFTQLSWISLIVLALTALVGLVLQASAVMDLTLAQALNPSELYKLLRMTSYGGAWLLEIVAIAASAFIIFLIARRSRKQSGNYAALLWVGFGASAILFLVPSLTGHAAAAANEYRFAVLTDWLHLVAGGVWVGGLIHLVLTLPRALSVFEGRERLRLLTNVIPRFTRYAIISTLLIALTGLYNTWMHVDSFSALWNTAYGRTLLLKVALFLPMLALGGVNTFILKPRAAKLLEEGGSNIPLGHAGVDRSFRRSVTLEVALGGVVLLLAAVLAFLQPARSGHTLMSERDSLRTVTGLRF